LLPTDPIAGNKNRQLMRMTELYLELPNRRLLPFSFSHQPAPEPLITEVIDVRRYISQPNRPNMPLISRGFMSGFPIAAGALGLSRPTGERVEGRRDVDTK